MGDNKIKVLIIDDDEIVLDVTQSGLETDGFEVITAVNGLQGIKKIEEKRPDVVLLDLKLPDIDGFEVCKRIRSDPGNADMHVIMITGDTTIDIDKAFALGADDCIIKPIDMGFLVARIGKLLKKKYRVLAVEDDRHICEILKNMLIKQDYNVEILHDGVKLIDAVKRVRPDIILLDIALPAGPDGVELCKLLKSGADTKTIPVIMLTANEHSDSVDKCFTYGAEDYIFKPYRMADLSQKIKKYLRISDSKSKSI